MPVPYPALLNLEGRRCVVVGGGPVAERKIRGLLETGARIVVVSPAATETIRRWANSSIVHWVDRPYQTGDLTNAFIVIAATSSELVNARIASDAGAAGVLTCVADAPTKGNVTLPAVLRRGDLVVAISTSGRSPALARHIREDLEALIPNEYAEVVDDLAELRARLRTLVAEPSVRERVWREIRQAGLIDLLIRRDVEQAEKLLAEAVRRHE